jgi:hypothetical protein
MIISNSKNLPLSDGCEEPLLNLLTIPSFLGKSMAFISCAYSGILDSIDVI